MADRHKLVYVWETLDSNCTDKSHRESLDSFSCEIIQKLQEASKTDFPGKIPHSIPGWNEVVKEYYSAARDAFTLWRDNGRPKHGAICELMRTSSAEFKYSLRHCRRTEAQHRANTLAKCLHKGGSRGFWSALHSQNGSKSSLPCTIDGHWLLRPVGP